MELWVDKKDLEFAEHMRSEGRTTVIPFRTFRFFKDEREVKVEVNIITNNNVFPDYSYTVLGEKYWKED